MADGGAMATLATLAPAVGCALSWLATLALAAGFGLVARHVVLLTLEVLGDDAGGSDDHDDGGPADG